MTKYYVRLFYFSSYNRHKYPLNPLWSGFHRGGHLGSGLSGWTQAVQITSDSESLAQVVRLRPQACSTTRLCVSTDSSHISLGKKKHVGKGLIEKVNLSQVYSAFHLRKQSSRLFPVWEQVLRVNAWATRTLPASVCVQASLRDKNDPHKCLVLSCSVVSFFSPELSFFHSNLTFNNKHHLFSLKWQALFIFLRNSLENIFISNFQVWATRVYVLRKEA